MSSTQGGGLRGPRVGPPSSADSAAVPVGVLESSAGSLAGWADAGVLAASALEQVRHGMRVLATLAAEGRLVELPAPALVDLDEGLHAELDRGAAVATVATHAVHVTGALSGTGFVSTSQWLQTRARVSKTDARAELGRGFDLAGSFTATRDAWLTGEVSGASVRVLTRGVSQALRAVPVSEHREATQTAQEILLDVARAGTVADVARAVDRLKMAADPDGVRQAALDAYDDQSVSFRRVGSMVNVVGWLTLENGALLATACEAIVDSRYRTGSLPAEEAPTGEDDRDARRRRLRRPHLLALALAELAERALADGALGTHRRVRPHVTLTIDVDTWLAGQGGELAIPGDMPALLPSESVARILCDADLAPVLTTPTVVDRDDGGGDPHRDAPRLGAVPDPPGGPPPDPVQIRYGVTVPGWRESFIAALREQTRTLLWLGRSRRTADGRLWTAVVTRDEHCTFPGCRVDASRCEIHHPLPWEHGGTTDPANSALLCVRHHHTVHEGGWIMTPVDVDDPLAPGHWQFDPPHARSRAA